MSQYPWIIINLQTGRWECQRCGESIAPPDWMVKVGTITGLMIGFIKSHKKCVTF